MKKYTTLLLRKRLNIAALTASLLILIVAALVPVSVLSQSVENPQSGSLGLGGIVPGPPPSTAPTITTPINGQTFTTLPVTVSGTCEAGLIVEIYKNDVFAGSAVCLENNTYELQIDLFHGANILTAVMVDLLGQQGPASNPIEVFYEPEVTTSDRILPQNQLLLLSDFSFKGADPNSEIVWPISISGGAGPYAISIDWGDGGPSDVVSRSDAGEFVIRHAYTNPGRYRVTLKATDSEESIAFLQLVSIVNGNGESTDDEPEPRIITSVLMWPLYVLLTLVPLAFWFGKRYEKHRLGA